MTLDQTHACFETTRWTLLGRLQGGDEPERAAALDSITRSYWPAVYANLRRAGRGRDAAAELTQSFFTDVVLGRQLLDQADPERGRLRTLILTALKRFAVDQHRRDAARNGDGSISLDELEREEAIIAAAPQSDPDAAFDRRWALALLNRALERAESHFRSSHKDRTWGAFAARVVEPAAGSCPPPPLSDLARRLGFAAPADAAAAVQTVKKRVLAILRECVAETTADPAQADAEYEQVLSLLS